MIFLGFTEDGSRFLIQVRDAHLGNLLSLRSVATNQVEKTLPVDQPADLETSIAKARKSFRIRDMGTESPTSPDGRYTIILVPKGPRVQVRVLRGERQAVLHSLEVRGGEEGPAQVQLKSVHWSGDGRSLVLILHRRDRAMGGEETDFVQAFRFLPSELRFGETP